MNAEEKLTGKAVLTFIATIVIGFIGLIVGASMNAEGYLGIIFAIATVGAFIVSSIKENQTK